MEVRGSGGGGCCIARCGTQNSNNYYSPYDMSKMDRIMLRFRPIAPKPIPGGGPTKPGSLNDDVKPGPLKGKRKTGTTRGGGKRRKSRSPDHHDTKRSDGEEKCHVVTLPLLPETPDLISPKNQVGPTWLSFGGSDDHVHDNTTHTVPSSQTLMVTSVTVERVTDTWLDGNGLGRTDDERRKCLEEDTCPGFISDGWNRVWWTNEAYRRMVITDTWQMNHPSSSCSSSMMKMVVVVVELGLKEKVELPAVKLFPAFTCKVRVQYGMEGSLSLTVPCDVWRLDDGGFAWRLDVKAALSLGR